MIVRTMLMGASALSLIAAAAAAKPPLPTGPAADFIGKAAQSDEFERREGRLAAVHAHSLQVKKFAVEMVAAHTKTTMGLKSAIRHSHMAVPPAPPLTDGQMHMIADLKALHGPAFDKAYMDQQVKAHHEALDVIQGYAQTGAPGPVRDAAQKTVPIVQHHLDMANQIEAHLGG